MLGLIMLFYEFLQKNVAADTFHISFSLALISSYHVSMQHTHTLKNWGENTVIKNSNTLKLAHNQMDPSM